MTSPASRLVPIVFLAVADHAAMAAVDPAATATAIRRVFNDFAGITIGRHGGKVVKATADSLLAEFASVISAVEWTAALQERLHNEPLAAAGYPVLLRAAVIMAEIAPETTALPAVGLKLVAAASGFAAPGGIAISRWVHTYIAGKVDLAFTDIGPQPFPGGLEGIELFTWHPDSNLQQQLAASHIAAAQRAQGPAAKPSVVVLPFENYSPDPDQAYFADAVVEEITSTLSRIGDFLVIARNTAFTYKGRHVDIREIGRELGVRYAVEGSVRRAGERVRITAQLVETDRGLHIWAGKAEGSAAELFDLQDRIAEMVAGNVYPSLRRAEIERALKKRPDSLEAYDLVMRALPHLWAHRMHENPEAIALLNRALGIDPNYGLAAALCAWAHAQQIVYNWTDHVEEERRKGIALIELAARHIGDDATGLTALGTAVMLLEGNPKRAMGFIDKAVQIDPNHAWAWMRRGFGLTYLGFPEEGLMSFTRAERLSPLDPFIFNIHIGQGLAHFAAGHYAEAVRFPEMVLGERPGLTWPYRDLAVFRAWAGDLPGAAEALEKFVYLRPPVTLASITENLRFMHGDLLTRYIEGLRLAGLQ